MISFTFAQTQGSREYQQDSAIQFSVEDTDWFIVCDGLGWHDKSGDIATKACLFMVDKIKKGTPIVDAIVACDKAVAVPHKLFSAFPSTTMSVLCYNPHHGFQAWWVGDSPIYSEMDSVLLARAGFGFTDKKGFVTHVVGQGNLNVVKFSEPFDANIVWIGSDGMIPAARHNFYSFNTAKEVVAHCAPLKGSDNVTVFVIKKETN